MSDKNMADKKAPVKKLNKATMKQLRGGVTAPEPSLTCEVVAGGKTYFGAHVATGGGKGTCKYERDGHIFYNTRFKILEAEQT